MLKEAFKCAVFSCLGLGDGLLSLVLSHNLQKNGRQVTTFHPFLSALQSWFPNLPLSGFPSSGEILGALSSYDAFFIFYENSSWMQKILQECQLHFPSKTVVLNPIATPHRDYPYWEGGKFDGSLPFLENLETFCKEQLHLPVTTRSNGIIPPPGLFLRANPMRVILHPVSSREGKNWPKEKYLALKEKLEQKGFSPTLILSAKEKKGWEDVHSPSFPNLEALAAYVLESGWMIGNDSGIGHLASCLGLPTLTLCRSRTIGNFWRPFWSPNVLVTPSTLIPNLKGIRLRDKYWKKWISVREVLSHFLALTRKHSPM